MTATEFEMPPDIVPPGDQTGIYYIPISNLPFNVSWQQIKDYVRQFSAVDHVEIFPKSTCGWVRVLEKENFEAAYENLNGKEFQGRSIIADKRNATQWLVVRDLNTPVSAKHLPSKSSRSAAPTTTSECSSFATGGPVCLPDSTIHPSPASTTSSAFSQGGDGYGVYSTLPSSSQSSDMSFPYVPAQGYDPPPMFFSPSNPVPFYGFGPCPNPPPPPYMHYPPSSCGPQAMCDPSGLFPVRPPPPPPPPPCYNEFYAFPTMNNQMARLALAESPPGGVIFTEQRGIHIREISRRTSEEELRRMVTEATGPEAGLIKLIDAPLDKNRNSSGWASVHFHSADLARRMVDRLNGAEFKGKTLQVRLMKEGEAIYYGPAAAAASGSSRTPSSAKQHHRGSKHHHRKEDGKKTERKERDHRGEKASTSERPAPSASGKPLVVGGSETNNLTATSATASSSSSKAKEKQGGSKKTSTTIIIADGSSSGRSKTGKR